MATKPFYDRPVYLFSVLLSLIILVNLETGWEEVVQLYSTFQQISKKVSVL